MGYKFLDLDLSQFLSENYFPLLSGSQFLLEFSEIFQGILGRISVSVPVTVWMWMS